MESTRADPGDLDVAGRHGTDRRQSVLELQNQGLEQNVGLNRAAQTGIDWAAHNVAEDILAPGSSEVREPHLSYKAAFLIGGIAFAVVTYIVGTVLYEIENRYFGSEHPLDIRIDSALQNIFPHHLLTLIPWVIGTTALCIGLGYLFDKQVKFRHLSEVLRARAEALAVTDSLTLAFSRGYLMQQVALEIGRAQRALSTAFALLFIDIDDFKKYNDVHGHLAGDDALRSAVMVLKQTVRSTDLVARYGGEELVVMMLGSTREEATILAERTRANVALHCPVTVSIGIAVFPDDGLSPDALLGRADKAMYRAKRSGKNFVCPAA